MLVKPWGTGLIAAPYQYLSPSYNWRLNNCQKFFTNAKQQMWFYRTLKILARLRGLEFGLNASGNNHDFTYLPLGCNLSLTHWGIKYVFFGLTWYWTATHLQPSRSSFEFIIQYGTLYFASLQTAQQFDLNPHWSRLVRSLQEKNWALKNRNSGQ